MTGFQKGKMFQGGPSCHLAQWRCLYSANELPYISLIADCFIPVTYIHRPPQYILDVKLFLRDITFRTINWIK
jgi:hypothetical protein